tara:strand:+ start:218 stop:616 length:399 start_codon:yes stop_codon:yes gene_type:complete
MKKFKFKIFKNKTGSLVPFTLNKDIPFKVKRIFIIYGRKNSKRADHAHHKCSQYLVPIFGSVNLSYENKKGIFNKKLSFKRKEGILLKPKTWCKIKFNTKDSKIMVFCDREYEYFDYIEHYKEFLTIIGKKR